MSRLKETFNSLKSKNEKAFSVFLMSGYPNKEAFLDLLKLSSDSGVDFIEVGMPFSDPSADGPTIKTAGTLALENGTTVKQTLDSICEFRKYDTKTPIVWMGYFNSIFNYGVEKFLSDIENAKVDGLLVVDLPPEEFARIEGVTVKDINVIQLVTPATTQERLPLVLKNAKGFVYFVSITGITGTKEADQDKIKEQVKYLQTQTDLPVVVGFGIKTPEKAAQINSFADGAIVGSALVNEISKYTDEFGNIKNKEKMLAEIKHFLSSFLRSRLVEK